MSLERSVATVKADLTEQVHAIMGQYPKARSAIMPALFFAQEKYGTVDEVTYAAVAEILEVPEIWVFEVASFYTMYNRKDVGKYHVQICTNVSCMLLGADEALDHLKARLGVEEGGTSADGQFTLTSVECIGACDVAPVMIINEEYYDTLTNARLDDILDSLADERAEAAQ